MISIYKGEPSLNIALILSRLLPHISIAIFISRKTYDVSVTDIIGHFVPDNDEIASVSGSHWGAEIQFQNGSIVKILVPNESSRGNRLNVVFIEDCYSDNTELINTRTGENQSMSIFCVYDARSCDFLNKCPGFVLLTKNVHSVIFVHRIVVNPDLVFR